MSLVKAMKGNAGKGYRQFTW